MSEVTRRKIKMSTDSNITEVKKTGDDKPQTSSSPEVIEIFRRPSCQSSKLTIIWKHNIVDIEIETEETVVDLEQIVCAGIQLELFWDLFSKIFVPVTMIGEDYILHKLSLNSCSLKLKVTAVLTQYLPRINRPSIS